MSETVYVVMSSYNGEKYIRQQIDSILSQEGVKVKLVIRDDGSSDGTRTILDTYKENESIDIWLGENIGYSKSFLALIHSVDESAEYIAISDQDDIWDKDKLKCALETIKKADQSLPILYSCGRRLLINGEIKQVSSNYIEYGFNGFTNGYALQGCSMVINKPLKRLVDLYTYQYMPCIYDALIMQICKYNSGIVLCDKSPHFTYRIHNNNSVGINSGVFGEIKKLISREYMPHTDEMCMQLLETYTDGIDPENQRICRELSNYKKGIRNKLSIIFDGGILRGSCVRKTKVIIELLLNKA